MVSPRRAERILPGGGRPSGCRGVGKAPKDRPAVCEHTPPHFSWPGQVCQRPWGPALSPGDCWGPVPPLQVMSFVEVEPTWRNCPDSPWQKWAGQWVPPILQGRKLRLPGPSVLLPLVGLEGPPGVEDGIWEHNCSPLGTVPPW